MKTKPQQKNLSTQRQAQTVGPGDWRDGKSIGLYLKVTTTLSRSWFWRYRLGTKRREMGLGSLADVSIAQARKKVLALTAQRNEGHDPIEARRRERADNLAKSRKKAGVTFAEATTQASPPGSICTLARTGSARSSCTPSR
jgi:hypothetical protein